MKILVKSVNGPVKQYEVDSNMKVEDLKKEIQKQQEYPAERQTLVFDGKVLKNDETLAYSGIAEGRFLVVVVTKPKATPAATSASTPAAAPTPSSTAASSSPVESTPATTSASAPSSTPAADVSEPAQQAAAAAAAPTTTGQPVATASGSSGDFYTSNASTLSAGPALEGHISQMVDMGFERPMVLRAMRAAFNNPDRAVEYLMSGIPEGAEAPQPVAAAPPAAATMGTPVTGTPAPISTSAPPAANTGPNAQPLDMFPQGFPAAVAGGTGSGTGSGAGGGALTFLRNNPQFQALRQVVQANPGLLQPMLQELGRQNPQLLALINSSQEEFLGMVNEPLTEGAAVPEGAPGLADMLSELSGGLDNEAINEAPTGQAIHVTEEEAAAIERLQALGFPRHACIEAFLACDKNEAMAANFLLSDASWE